LNRENDNTDTQPIDPYNNESSGKRIHTGEMVIASESSEQEGGPERSLIYLRDQLEKLRQEEHELISRS
jgi:hypothetical protein